MHFWILLYLSGISFNGNAQLSVLCVVYPSINSSRFFKVYLVGNPKLPADSSLGSLAKNLFAVSINYNVSVK